VDLRDLVHSLLDGDTLSARQWVADACRLELDWRTVRQPEGLDLRGLAVAAGIAELLAARASQQAPSWAANVGAAPEPIYLVRSALTMPRLLRVCLEEAPEPLRRRRILAPPEFLTAA
jgi:hypothetical protein